MAIYVITIDFDYDGLRYGIVTGIPRVYRRIFLFYSISRKFKTNPVLFPLTRSTITKIHRIPSITITFARVERLDSPAPLFRYFPWSRTSHNYLHPQNGKKNLYSQTFLSGNRCTEMPFSIIHTPWKYAYVANQARRICLCQYQSLEFGAFRQS